LIAYVKDKYGQLDLLVNNAGIAPRERRDILEATEEIFDEVLDTNLKGPYFLTQLAARMMVAQGSGRIVFITSISVYTASVMRGEYCISKAGLGMAVSLWAARLAAHGIGVFEVRPGIIRTDMIEKVKDAYEEKAKSGLLPQGRLGDPEDVAKAVRAVAEGYLDYGTGTVINADGGFHLRTL
jgi:NAD(P)-dependent dehydrogenase (short-subunit alcohol dehydrogenase family)